MTAVGYPRGTDIKKKREKKKRAEHRDRHERTWGQLTTGMERNQLFMSLGLNWREISDRCKPPNPYTRREEGNI